MSVELHQITLNVLVNKDNHENDPEHWDWREMLDTWAVPVGPSTKLRTFEDTDTFFEALDEGRV